MAERPRRMPSRWRVANFVTPEWFDPVFREPAARDVLLGSGRGFDHARRLVWPGQLGIEGYVILREGRRTWAETWDGAELASRPAGKRHAMSRTERLLGGHSSARTSGPL